MGNTKNIRRFTPKEIVLDKINAMESGRLEYSLREIYFREALITTTDNAQAVKINQKILPDLASIIAEYDAKLNILERMYGNQPSTVEPPT